MGDSLATSYFGGRSRRNPRLSERGDERKRKTYSLGPKVGGRAEGSGLWNVRQWENWRTSWAFMRGVGPLLEVFWFKDGFLLWGNLQEVGELRWASGPEGGLAAGKAKKLQRSKRPLEMGTWPLRGGGAPAAWSHVDEEAVLVSGDPLRAL